MEPADLLHGLKETKEFGVFIDPLLVHAIAPKALERVYDFAHERATALYHQYAHIQQFSGLLDVPYSLYVTRLCLLETLLSTATTIAHEQTGDIVPTKATLEEAEDCLHNLVHHGGIEPLYATYYGIVGHDLLQPFVHYKDISQAEFLNASRHHPYRPESLDVFLLIALYRRVLRLRTTGGRNYIAITRVGTKTYQWMHNCLVESGYTHQRIQMSHLYQFSSVQGWDDLSSLVWPDINRVREAFLDWLPLRDDQTVLEVGCGTGSLTLDAGLIRKVRHGSVIATDASAEMLARARSKVGRYGSPENVQFAMASVEDLPYNDNTFDACCGSFFLQFVNPVKALREMTRVTKAGGLVSVVQLADFDTKTQFFRDWFEPVLQLPGSFGDGVKQNSMVTAEDLREWFQQAGLSAVRVTEQTTPWIFEHPETVVQHVIRGVSFIQRALAELPWDDQNTLVLELVDRGRDVCRHYPMRDRTIDIPAILISGQKQPLDGYEG